MATALSAQEAAQPTLEGQPEAQTGEGESAAGSEDQRPPEQPQPIDITPALKGIETAIREFEADEDEREREGEKQRDIRDLDAQEDMAFWAKAMTLATGASVLLTLAALIAEWQKIPTIAQLILAGIAAVGLIVSLILTRQSIVLNRKATDAAVKGNAATIKAIDQEQANSQRGLRAYIGGNGMQVGNADPTVPVDDKEYKIRVQAIIKNFGTTPAYQVKLALVAGNYPIEGKRSDFIPDKIEHSGRNGEMYIPPSFHIASSGVDIPLDGLISQWHDGIIQVVSIEVWYVDAFGEPHTYRHSSGLRPRVPTEHLCSILKRGKEDPFDHVLMGSGNGSD